MTDWQGCYDGNWNDLIVPGAFAHPAKFARGLAERIVQHGLDRGWFAPGDLIADPFGGVGLGGLIAAYRGLRWVGVELEQRFAAKHELRPTSCVRPVARHSLTNAAATYGLMALPQALSITRRARLASLAIALARPGSSASSPSRGSRSASFAAIPSASGSSPD